jgi:hypothetical protein
MEDLFIAANRKRLTPLIDFKLTGELIIEGRSIPEDAIEFYRPALKWINDLTATSPKKITMTFRMEYFNTSSSKVLLSMLNSLKRIRESGKTKVYIVWFYEENDSDMFEAAEGFQSITKLPFLINSFASNDCAY